jgi:hypothetical protein
MRQTERERASEREREQKERERDNLQLSDLKIGKSIHTLVCQKVTITEADNEFTTSLHEGNFL